MSRLGLVEECRVVRRSRRIGSCVDPVFIFFIWCKEGLQSKWLLHNGSSSILWLSVDEMNPTPATSTLCLQCLMPVRLLSYVALLSHCRWNSDSESSSSSTPPSPHTLVRVVTSYSIDLNWFLYRSRTPASPSCSLSCYLADLLSHPMFQTSFYKRYQIVLSIVLRRLFYTIHRK